ncbi:hypothetical protein AVEN_128523-1 [Araneus ventricosus]|uniref:Uncharacterized protein n=1 Tax=Araneus ventricosus TaxID=182803 RepID=A0A4Y2HNP2_ARAVE|nr:hypothetical protein AVEN_128523-1 [Araneus ventricosus]
MRCYLQGIGHSMKKGNIKIEFGHVVTCHEDVLVTAFDSRIRQRMEKINVEEDAEKNVSVMLDGDEHEISFIDPPTMPDTPVSILPLSIIIPKDEKMTESNFARNTIFYMPLLDIRRFKEITSN